MNNRRDEKQPYIRPPAPPAPAEMLLPSVSIVEQTMDQARRAVALALTGAAIVVAGLLVERMFFSMAQDTAADRHAQSQRLAGEVRLADQQLTAAAQMAAATGDRSWVAQYDSLLPKLDAALDQVRMLAPAEASRSLDVKTRAASQDLTSMRESAFAAVSVGEVEVARSIFRGARYQMQSQLLAAAIEEFTSESIASTYADLVKVRLRMFLMGAAIVLAGALLGAGLWHRLTRRLERSRAYFLSAEDRIQRLASSDMLTGLANRTALHDAMATAMVRAKRDGHRLAVLMLDLDRFKPVNDRHGHMIGDLVLKEVAHRLKGCLRSGELHARYGGDEFVVAIEERGDATVARTVAERIVETISKPMLIDQLSVSIGVSIGIARFPDDASLGDELLRRADSALYRAKSDGRGNVCFYDGRLDEQVAERASLEYAVREGIALGQFVPYYQPIVDLATRKVQSLEVLCRWQHPERGLLAPAEFIALAETSGLIGPMMMSVLHQVCQDIPRFPKQWRFSINVAPQQLLDPELVKHVLAILREHGVPPERLDIELTETALVSDTAGARRVMQAMKDAGITVTLDDFGTGYSSLCYLAEMTFDKIKIDRSFVRTLHERTESATIVDAVISLSRSLGAQTVAEGIETQRDAEALKALGCSLAQGYLFGRPLPADEVVTEQTILEGADDPTPETAAAIPARSRPWTAITA